MFRLPIYLIGGCIPSKNNQHISKGAIAYPTLLAFKYPTSFHLPIQWHRISKSNRSSTTKNQIVPLLLLSSENLHHFHSQAPLKPAGYQNVSSDSRIAGVDINHASGSIKCKNKMLLTQQPTVFNCAKEGRYFCFCASEPHSAILGHPNKQHNCHEPAKKALSTVKESTSIQISPIVSIAREEWTKMKVEQLASTLETSAVATALAVIERPGHP